MSIIQSILLARVLSEFANVCAIFPAKRMLYFPENSALTGLNAPIEAQTLEF
jgi:hypothetical protein